MEISAGSKPSGEVTPHGHSAPVSMDDPGFSTSLWPPTSGCPTPPRAQQFISSGKAASIWKVPSMTHNMGENREASGTVGSHLRQAAGNCEPIRAGSPRRFVGRAGARIAKPGAPGSASSSQAPTAKP
jgi:hypothetical protein